MIEMQRTYWDDLSAHYQASMQISITDFHYGPQIPGESQLGLLPPLQPGMRALELGCGAAQNSIWLARQGLVCTAVDLSREQLRHARQLAQVHGVELRLLNFAIEELGQHLDESFDFIHSSHAMEFVGDPAQCIAHMAARLVPGGFLVISTVHPLFNGEWVEQADYPGAENEMGLFLRNYFTPPDDERWAEGKLEVISRAYPVSAWFQWLRQAGLEVVQLVEPAAVPEGAPAPYTNEDWACHEGQLHAIPNTLILAGRRHAQG